MDGEALICVQDLRTFAMPDSARGKSAFTVQLWWLVSDTIFRGSPQVLYGLRRMLLRLFGAKIGKKVLIRPTARITFPWKLRVGDYAWIGDFTELYNIAEIDIGANAVISQYAQLCTGSHDPQDPAFPIVAAPITVESEAWVAMGAMLYPGVRVGRGAVVAARSVLRGDARDMLVYAGSPARPIANRLQPVSPSGGRASKEA
jgi:putative colanic acid biosynthesis acetyltransferase WcaF